MKKLYVLTIALLSISPVWASSRKIVQNNNSFPRITLPPTIDRKALNEAITLAVTTSQQKEIAVQDFVKQHAQAHEQLQQSLEQFITLLNTTRTKQAHSLAHNLRKSLGLHS